MGKDLPPPLQRFLPTSGVTMPDIQPGAGSSEARQPLRENPVSSFSSQLEQFSKQLQLIFEDPENFFEEVLDDIRTHEPEERFTESIEIFLVRINEEFGSVEAFQSQFPAANRKRYLDFAEQLFQNVIGETVQGVLYQRDAEAYVLMAAAYQVVLSDVQLLQESDSDYNEEQLASSMLAVLARIYGLKDQEEFEGFSEEFVRDIVRGLYYTSKASNQPAPSHPDDLDYKAVKQEALNLGAAVAYAWLDISVNRGAELADLSLREFERVLGRFDVPIRYGPSSIDELREDDYLDERR